MMRWIGALATALARKAPSRAGLAGTGGDEDLASSSAPTEHVRDALELAWVAVEALLAAPSLPPEDPLGAVLLRGARWVRGGWRDVASFRQEMRACRAALSAARHAGTLTPPEDLPIPHADEDAPPEWHPAYRELDDRHPGLRMVAKLRWADGPLLPTLAGALMARLVAEDAEGWDDDAPGAADLAAVADALILAPDETRRLLDAVEDPPAPASHNINGRNGHHAPPPGPLARFAAGADLDADELEAALAESIAEGGADAHALERRGDLYSRLGRADEALAAYSRACALSPQTASAFLKRGDLQRARGEHERAVADYTQALVAWPDGPAALTRRAAVFRALGRLAEADHDLREALSLDPCDPAVHRERGELLLGRGEAEGAAIAFGVAVSLAPEDAEGHCRLAHAHLARADAPAAEASFSEALRLSPALADALAGRGKLRATRGDLEGGLDDLNRAVDVAADPAHALLERAPVFARLGHLGRAMEDCDALLRHRPTSAEAWVLRGRLAADQGALEDAEDAFTRALALSPGLARAHEGRGSCAARRGKLAEALADLAEAARLDPNNVAVFRLRGELNARAGRPLEALADLQQAALLDPALLPGYYAQRAQLHLARGEYALALADAVIEARLDPDSPGAIRRQEQARDGLRLQQEAKRHTEPEAEGRPAPGSSAAARRAARPRPAPRRAGPAPETAIAMPVFVPQTPHPAPPPPGVADGPGERDLPAPTLEAPALPDQAVPPPATATPAPTMETVPAAPTGPIGPIEGRLHRESSWAQIEERARRWDDVHGPRPAGLDVEHPPRPRSPQPEEEDDSERFWTWRRVAAAMIGVLLLGGLGYGIHWLNQDPRRTAAEVWEEFSKDSKGAAERYKGRFVVVSGPVRVLKEAATARVYFLPPGGDKAPWCVELPLSPADAQRVQDKAVITVRGRFASRKTANETLLMSNCNVVEVKRAG